MKQTTIIAMFASLLFSGVATACQHNVATIPAQDYAGSYMIVDGKRYDNLREIKDDIQQTLAEARQIEREADGQAVIEEAEQEVLESIGDPAERQKLKEILKN